MKNLIDYAYQDNGTDFRKELYSAIHDKVAAHIESKKQEIASGYMGKQEESYEEEGESLDEALPGKNVGDADSHLHHSRNIIDMSKSHVTRQIRKASALSNELRPNKDASDDTIYKGLKHPDELTGVSALLHPNAKDHHVIKALKHRHSEVRAVAVFHPLAPRDIVDHMARNDVDPIVRSQAKQALSERDR